MVAKQQKRVCKNSIAIHMKWWILKLPPNQCIKKPLTSYHGLVHGPTEQLRLLVIIFQQLPILMRAVGSLLGVWEYHKNVGNCHV